MIRLNKFISESGYCSRRKADELIAEGKVKVNGTVTDKLGTMVDEINDDIVVEQEHLKLEEEKLYIVLNKPRGYVTTSSDELGRKSVLDLINERCRVFPVGRLDMDTEGMLILTNDGEFANKLMHPKNKIYKTYIAKTDYDVSEAEIEKLKNGVDIDGYITAPAIARKLKRNLVEIKISEGKNRQIRKMLLAVNKKVLKLKRTAIGNMKLPEIKVGSYKKYSLDEITKKIYK